MVVINDNPEFYLSKTSQVLHEMKYYIGDHEANICSEIAISDVNGLMQFLRKSVSTGGYKYSKTFDPKQWRKNGVNEASTW